jgi:hypothetical protein
MKDITNDSDEETPINKSNAKPIIKNAFRDMLKDNSEENQVLKELFNKTDIEIKTEMQSIEEIGAFAKYFWLANMKFTKDTNLKDLLTKQLELRLSNKRKSRREFLEGFKRTDIGQTQKRGFFERLGFGGNG